jgi:hypothetical protein
MKSFKEFYKNNYYIIDEEIHNELQSILDVPSESEEERTKRLEKNPWTASKFDPAVTKLNNFTKKARELLSRGEDTGLENSKPKKGSSRAVFFPKDPKNITLDGIPTKAKTVVKIAFPGRLDKFRRNDERLLGEHQNSTESDHVISNNFGMLSENHDGSYSTNPDGVLAPVFNRHPDHHHLEMGHVSPMKKSDFQKLTVSESHPKGLKFDDMYNALNKEHKDANGLDGFTPRSHTDSLHEKTMQHPFVNKVADMMFTNGFHPGDISIRNMGIWTHPHTGKQYPVMSDYGFTDDVANHYWQRRQRASRNY